MAALRPIVNRQPYAKLLITDSYGPSTFSSKKGPTSLAPGEFDMTPLMKACSSGKAKGSRVALRLLEANADVNYISKSHEMTALKFAVHSCTPEVSDRRAQRTWSNCSISMDRRRSSRCLSVALRLIRTADWPSETRQPDTWCPTSSRCFEFLDELPGRGTSRDLSISLPTC